MKVSVKEVSEITRKVTVELPQEQVERQLQKAYRQLNRTARVKGFRPGKVPLSILKRHYADQVHYDVGLELVNQTMVEALQQTEMQTVSQSDLDRAPLQEGEPFQYSFLAEIKPEITATDYRNIPAQRQLQVVSDEEVEAEIEKRRQSSSYLKSLDKPRPVEQGDHVVLDLKAFVGGKPVADGEAKGFVLEVGANRFHPDFETKLIGAGKGDHKEIEVTFPKDYGNKELAGKATTFKAEIKDIKERLLPDLDDDLAKNLGEFESLAELRHAIRQEIEDQKKAQTDDAVAEQILNELLQRNPFEIPQAMVEQELQRMLDTIRYRLSAQNISLEQTGMDENRLKEEHRETAGKKVRKTLLLEQISNQEDLNVGDEELDQRLHQAAKEAEQPYEKIRDFYEKNDLTESFKRQLIEEKVIEFLMNHAEITEVEGEAAGSEDDNQKKEDSS